MKEITNELVFSAVALALVAAAVGPATAQDVHAAREAAIWDNPLKAAFFGETHAHAACSLDACIGGARLTLFDSYRFATGEDVSVNNVLHNIERPLDFVAVSDHAEFLGEMLST